MPALLSNQVDLFTQKTRLIKSTALQTASREGEACRPGLFSQAVLFSELGDLIRDIDSTELGLFNFPSSSSFGPPDKRIREPHIKRAEFSGATPLRVNPSHREEKPREYEPEIYAQAALKCLHRYDHIRPMPRAHHQIAIILGKLEEARNKISSFQATLNQQLNTPGGPFLKSQIEDEEQRLTLLHARMRDLKRRKAHVPDAGHVAQYPPTPYVSTTHEGQFWTTPGEASRTLRFTEKFLVDEQVEFPDDIEPSFSSPVMTKESGLSESSTSQHFFSTTRPKSVESLYNGVDFSTPSTPPDLLSEGVDKQQPESGCREQSGVVSTSPSPAQVEADTETYSCSNSKVGRVRINEDVEKIMSKIFLTLGDSLITGYNKYQKPPDGKEIIKQLQQMSNLRPIPDSPSQSSGPTFASSRAPPSSQQILTSYLLILLLNSGPQYSMPLNKVKESLSVKAKSGDFSVATLGQGATRILYGCVAKRLIRIDRSGGEQIVKFDY